MAKYICKNNPAHTFTEPTADFWCPLCEKNTGMLELVDEATTPIEDDGKIDALEEEIELLKKEFSKLYDSSNEKSTDQFSNQSENEGNKFNNKGNNPKNIFKKFLNSWQILFGIFAVTNLYHFYFYWNITQFIISGITQLTFVSGVIIFYKYFKDNTLDLNQHFFFIVGCINIFHFTLGFLLVISLDSRFDYYFSWINPRNPYLTTGIFLLIISFVKYLARKNKIVG